MNTKIQSTPTIHDQYDRSYKKERSATIAGLILLVIYFVVPFFINDLFHVYLFSLAIFIRVAGLYWVVDIAKRQNRDSVLWGIFAFFFPAIALIIIGSLNKLYESDDDKNAYRQHLDDTADLFGKFFTEESEITKKIGNELSTMWEFKYAGGILENEIQKDIAIIQPPLELHQYGMHIQLKTNDNKYYNLVVGYNEIQDILYDQDQKLVTFYLFNDMSSRLFFDVKDDSCIELKYLCDKYLEVTGKTPTAKDVLK